MPHFLLLGVKPDSCAVTLRACRRTCTPVLRVPFRPVPRAAAPALVPLRKYLRVCRPTGRQCVQWCMRACNHRGAFFTCSRTAPVCNKRAHWLQADKCVEPCTYLNINRLISERGRNTFEHLLGRRQFLGYFTSKWVLAHCVFGCRFFLGSHLGWPK